jgi:release factor glutamine methyltransferase
MSGNHTTGELLATATARLAASGSATPHLEAELLLAHVRGQARARLKSHPEDRVDAAHSERFRALIERRAASEPLAYLVGFKDFWTLRLAVTPAVLVPRPETELLVERALHLRPEAAGCVLDLGTGSGAIALALASERSDWQVTATDVSADALAVARANAASLGLARVEWLQGSWFEPLALRRFDLIVSNPPYIGAGEPELSAAELRSEPRGALSPGEDALSSLRAIVHGAGEHLEPGGWLLLEHGARQAAELTRELVGRGFRHVRSHRDLAGHERTTEAQWAIPHTK